MKKGFTLAEVLITLGIIGVVAAITLPILIQNYQKKVFSTRAKQAYSLLAQAIKLSEIENGDINNCSEQAFTQKSTETFVEKCIKPYFKELRLCSKGLDEKCGAVVSQYGLNYLTNNGTSIAIVTGDKNAHRIIHITIDVNNSNKPNIIGKDRFIFIINDNGQLFPAYYDKNITREKIKTGYTYTAPWGQKIKMACRNTQKSSDEYNRHACTLLLFLDGWEFKEDYPW